MLDESTLHLANGRILRHRDDAGAHYRPDMRVETASPRPVIRHGLVFAEDGIGGS